MGGYYRSMPGVKRATEVVRLYPETKARLWKLRLVDETAEDVVRKLIDLYEQRRGTGQEAQRKAS